jgi:hypothetical protein
MSKSLELHCSLFLGLNSCGCDAKLAIAYERGRFAGVREVRGAWPYDVLNAPISTIPIIWSPFSAIELPSLPKERVSYDFERFVAPLPLPFSA